MINYVTLCPDTDRTTSRKFLVQICTLQGFVSLSRGKDAMFKQFTTNNASLSAKLVAEFHFIFDTYIRMVHNKYL